MIYTTSLWLIARLISYQIDDAIRFVPDIQGKEKESSSNNINEGEKESNEANYDEDADRLE